MRTAFLLLCTLATGLTGCAAALIPVAAGGLIGKKALHHRGGAGDAPVATAAPPPQVAAASSAPEGPPAAAPVPAPPMSRPTPLPAAPSPEPAPAPISTPASGSDDRSPAPGRSPVAAAPAPSSPGTRYDLAWTAMLRHVATWSSDSGTSVLVARHGSDKTRAWVPCEAKPEAVIVATAASPDGRGDSVIDALRALHTAVVFTSVRPQADDPYFAGRAPSHRLMPGDLFVQVPPGGEGAARARIGARYCVIAIIGTAPADFPDGVLPGTSGASPGWFRVATP